MNGWSLYRDVGPYHLSLVDAEPFAEVLNHLRRLYSLNALAQQVGVSRYELSCISLGQRTRIRRETADKLRVGLLELLPS